MITDRIVKIVFGIISYLFGDHNSLNRRVPDTVGSR